MTKTEIQNLLREHGIIDTVWKLNTPDQLLTPISDWAEHERVVTQIRAIPELRPQLVTTGAWMADGRRFVYAIFKFDGQHE